MKNLTNNEYRTRKLAKLDATELKKRAAEDAVKDADSYAIGARTRPEKAPALKGIKRVSNLMDKQEPTSVESPEDLDGILVHANDCGASLALSDEILRISLPDEVAALAEEPIKIFHVDGAAPWVEHIVAGNA